MAVLSLTSLPLPLTTSNAVPDLLQMITMIMGYPQHTVMWLWDYDLLIGCQSDTACIQEIAECLQQNAKSEKATAFLIWKALLFSVVALTTISEHLHHRIYFTVANILQSPVHAIQCFASWLSMCKVEMALINISSSN